MRKVINKYIEKIFKTIPEIVFIVHDKIIDIISKYQKAENRELVLFWLHLKNYQDFNIDLSCWRIYLK